MRTTIARHGAIAPMAFTLLAAFAVGWLLARSVTAPLAAHSPAEATVEIAAPASGAPTTFALGDPARPGRPASGFSTWELHVEHLDRAELVDPDSLAAWQIRVRLAGAKAVGLEGGSSPRFREPPHYDPAALVDGALVLAAFSTEPMARHPVDDRESTVHVATLHLQLEASTDAIVGPTAELLVEAAAGRDGTPLNIRATLLRSTDR